MAPWRQLAGQHTSPLLLNLLTGRGSDGTPFTVPARLSLQPLVVTFADAVTRSVCGSSRGEATALASWAKGRQCHDMFLRAKFDKTKSKGRAAGKKREQYACALRADTDGNSRRSTTGIVWLSLNISLCGVGDNACSRAHTTIQWDDGFAVSYTSDRVQDLVHAHERILAGAASYAE